MQQRSCVPFGVYLCVTLYRLHYPGTLKMHKQSRPPYLTPACPKISSCNFHSLGDSYPS